MARINVEDDFWTHPRYRYLVRLVGDEDKATGMCIRAWRIAQRFWADKKTIPLEVWDLENLEPMVTVGLAERREDGVYCRGSEKHFEWYSHRIAAGRRGGQRSAAARAEKFGTAQPCRDGKAPKQTRSKASKSPKQARSESPEAPKPLALALYAENANLPKGGDVWSAYRAAYFARYAVEPVRNARVNANCKQLVDRLGGDGAVAVVRFYLGHNNAYYVQKSHALGLCLADAEALHTQMLNGQAVTGAAARSADEKAANAQAFANVAARMAARRQEGGGGDD